MKKTTAIAALLALCLLGAACGGQDAGGAQNFPAPAASAAAQTGGALRPEGEGIDHDYTVTFQSKNKQIRGVMVYDKQYIPLIEFVEDMGYTYTIDGNTITIQNSDMGVEHVLHVDSDVVATGDQQRTMFGPVRVFKVGSEDVLYVPTQLYDIFIGNYSD